MVSFAISLQKQHKQNKREEPGTVITAADRGLNVLQTLLKTIASVKRKIAIGVDNKTPYDWEALNTYFYSGSSDEILLEFVKKGQAGSVYCKEEDWPRSLRKCRRAYLLRAKSLQDHSSHV